MSEKYLDLVDKLTPPGRRYDVTAPSVPRARFVLFVLAYLADDDGVAIASVAAIAARTQHSPPMVRSALSDLEATGLIEITREPSAVNVYRLCEDQLVSQQFDNLLRAGEPTVNVLSTYGLDNRSLNALHREEIHTIDKLAERVAQYEKAKAEYEAQEPQRELMFNQFLAARGLGTQSARNVLASYAAWRAEVSTVDASTAETGSSASTAQV